MGTDDIIKIENLNFSYSNSETGKTTEVLRNINLNVRRGEFVAVLGHNGSGKSTLAKLMNAILTPTSGRVLADGIDTADEDRLFDIRSRVGMVFQNPDNQIVTTIVEEDVRPQKYGKEWITRLKPSECTSFGEASRTTFRADRSSALPLREFWL